jgi:hypothetical protein
MDYNTRMSKRKKLLHIIERMRYDAYENYWIHVHYNSEIDFEAGNAKLEVVHQLEHEAENMLKG